MGENATLGPGESLPAVGFTEDFPVVSPELGSFRGD